VATAKHGDARNLDIANGSIDLVLTSPPYLNAIDYMRCSKFALVWMGYNVGDLRRIRAVSVGTEASTSKALKATWVKELIGQLRLRPELGRRHHGLLAQYVWDMERALAETSRVLKPRARAVYVVGDSTVRGTFIRNSEIVTTVAQRHGLALVSKHSRELPDNRRYLPPPKNDKPNTTIDRRMRLEVVLEFQKV
jgi:DNA modification methylase